MLEETVKNELVTIPYIDCSTVGMVADYYGVPKTMIRDRYHTHKNELDKKGVMVVSPKELEDLLPNKANYRKTTHRCVVTYSFDNGQDVSIHVAKNWVFTKDAVDYMGTILPPGKRGKGKQPRSGENKVAVVKKSSVKFHTEEEKTLCLKLAKAFASGDTIKLLTAALDLDLYRIGHIAELSGKSSETAETSDKFMPWTNRASANKIVSTISSAVNTDKTTIWNRIYFKLIHEYKLPLEERRVMPLIDAVENREWHLFYQALVSVCEENLLDIRQVLKRAGINAKGLTVLVNIEGGDM